MHVTDNEIAKLLRDYKQTKKDVRDIRAEMLRLTLEDLGMKRKTVLHINLETFLDGYLAGQKMAQSCRNAVHDRISDLLNNCREAQSRARNYRVEMLKVAVQELGMAQVEAIQANLEVFFDGYLIGKAVISAPTSAHLAQD